MGGRQGTQIDRIRPDAGHEREPLSVDCRPGSGIELNFRAQSTGEVELAGIRRLAGEGRGRAGAGSALGRQHVQRCSQLGGVPGNRGRSLISGESRGLRTSRYTGQHQHAPSPDRMRGGNVGE